MKVVVTIWQPDVPEEIHMVEMPLSVTDKVGIVKGNERVIRRVFKEAIKPYTKFDNMKQVTYNAIHKCASYGGDDRTDVIAKVKFVDIAPTEAIYEKF